ncbi:MAG TPA: MFS transporter, partial [Chloroflexota bacterium]|nr:MFS transporter [Chloroflexota bacterium]
GAVADRFDRYKLTVVSYIVQIIPDAALAWLVISGNIRVEYVFAYSIVTATINGLATPARQAFVPSLVGKEALLSAMALNSVVWQGSAVIGPAVAGMILALWGLPGSFNINVASDFVSLATIAFVRVAPIVAAKKSSGWNEIREGLAYAWRQPKVRVLLVSVALTTLLARPYTQLMPAFARDVFQVGPQGLGWMLTVPALGTVVAGTILAAASRISLVRVYIVTVGMMAGGLLGFCLTRSFPVSLALLFVVGGCSTASVTVVNTMLQQIAEERLRGRVMSLYMASTWGAWRLGSLPLGVAAAAWGPPAAVGGAAVLLLGILIPIARNPALNEVDKEPAHEPPAAVEAASA